MTYFALAIAAFGIVAVGYGIRKTMRGTKARGLVLVALGLAIVTGAGWLYLRERRSEQQEQQRHKEARDPPVEPYPDD